MHPHMKKVFPVAVPRVGNLSQYPQDEFLQYPQGGFA
jgi:hypothetical protein